MKSMIVFFYFILIILAFNIKKSIQSYIIYPFKKSTKQIKLYPQNLLQNDLEITIEIGTPPQNIDLNIRFQYYTFFIASLKTNLSFPVFNESNSKSLVMISHRVSSVGGQEFISCYRINESIIINHQEIKNISLALATSLAYNESGVIGFGLVKSHDFGGALSFLYQMKNKINLDNYAFTLRYDNDDGGELILGTYPHLYDKNYKNKKFLYTKVGNIGVKIDWVLDFDYIKYDNQIINGIITKSLIKVEFGLIQAPIGLMQYFNDNFFFNKCKEEFCSGKNLTIIHCVFDNKTINSDPFWVLGELFIKKYQLVYDLDKKIIGLYTENGNGKVIDSNNNIKNNKRFNIYLLIIFILFWIIIALIIFIFLFFNKPKRNKALELNDDSLDYFATN